MSKKLSTYTLSSIFFSSLLAASTYSYAEEFIEMEKPKSSLEVIDVEKDPVKIDPLFSNDLLRSKLNQDLIREIDESTQHLRAIESIVRETEILKKEIELSQAKLLKEKSLKDIDDLLNESKDSVPVNQPQSQPQNVNTRTAGFTGIPGSPGISVISGGPSTSGTQGFPGMPGMPWINPEIQDGEPVRPASAVELDLIDKVYLNRLYGIGDNQIATVFVDNIAYNVKVGDEILEGVYVSSIDSSSIKISKNKKTKTLRVSNQKRPQR